MVGIKEADGSFVFQRKEKGPLLPGVEESAGTAFVVRYSLLCVGHS